MATKPTPALNIGPGRVIRRNLEEKGWSNADLAEILGCSEKTISQLLNDKQAITVTTARLLGKAFSTSPEFWLNLDQNYRLRLAPAGKREADAEAKARIRTHLPILEMKKRGWISYDATAASQVKAYKKFWDGEDKDFSAYEKEALPFCARQGKEEDPRTRDYRITWFQKAKTEAARIKAKPYDKKALEALAEELPACTLNEKGPRLFLSKLKACGIKFLLLEHLSKTYLDGASFMDGRNPVVVYTARFDRLDNFWWTLAHELAHVILHIKAEEDSFLDNLQEDGAEDRKEKEADALAGKWLKERATIEAARPYSRYMTEERLRIVAEDVGMGPEIVLGILKHNGVVEWRTLPQIRKSILDQLAPKQNMGQG